MGTTLFCIFAFYFSTYSSTFHEQILDATRELLTESTHRALNDPEILDHSMEFATDVVGDNVLQRTSGEALRNTVTYAVKPSLSTCKLV